jgi:hypothetical protein
VQFEEANSQYLNAAEELVYNPADSEKERLVAELVRKRDAIQVQLRSAIESEVEDSFQQALQETINLTRKRDAIEAALKRSN